MDEDVFSKLSGVKRGDDVGIVGFPGDSSDVIFPQQELLCFSVVFSKGRLRFKP